MPSTAAVSSAERLGPGQRFEEAASLTLSPKMGMKKSMMRSERRSRA
jgi:hypothetical protein